MNRSDLFACLKKLMPDAYLSIDPAELSAAAHNGLGQRGQPPICILRLGNTEELGALIQYADENNLCLTVTSSTGTHRKGGITNSGEHILVDLSHWKKIDLICVRASIY